MSRCGGFRRTSYRIVVFICDRAVVCCRCRSLCSLFCGCSCALPAPVNSPQPIAFARFVGVSGVRLGQMSRRISCVFRRALVAFRGCLREVADGTGQIRGLLCFWNLSKAAFCSAQSVIANVPGGNAGREFPVVRIAEWPESNNTINRTRTSFFDIHGVLVHSTKRPADNKDPRGLTKRMNSNTTHQPRQTGALAHSKSIFHLQRPNSPKTRHQRATRRRKEHPRHTNDDRKSTMIGDTSMPWTGFPRCAAIAKN